MGDVIVFTTNRGTSPDLYLARRTASGFATPTVALTSITSDTMPVWSTDGSTVYYRVGFEEREATYVENTGNGFLTSQRPVAAFLTGIEVEHPTFTQDGLIMLWSDGDDLYGSMRATTGNAFQTSYLVPNLNAPGTQEASPSLTSDDLRIYFTSDRDIGLSRVYTATRTNTAALFDMPTPVDEVGMGINTVSVSHDGTELYMGRFDVGQSFELYVSQRLCP